MQKRGFKTFGKQQKGTISQNNKASGVHRGFGMQKGNDGGKSVSSSDGVIPVREEVHMEVLRKMLPNDNQMVLNLVHNKILDDKCMFKVKRSDVSHATQADYDRLDYLRNSFERNSSEWYDILSAVCRADIDWDYEYGPMKEIHARSLAMTDEEMDAWVESHTFKGNLEDLIEKAIERGESVKVDYFG